MTARRLLRSVLVGTATLLGLLTVGNAGRLRGQNQDDELQMGQEVFNELKAKGEIIESSPLYDQLRPIADAITRAAQPRYSHPFKFYLVHEAQPNAFATNNQNRVDALEQHFRDNPSVFAKFNPNPGSATPFAVPKKAPEVFLR